MKVVIISGGIGSGKSTVCNMLEQQYGWPIYEADKRVKELYLSHPSLLSSIETALGTVLRDEYGAFVPYLLADRIFSDKESLSAVESLVFPVLIEDFFRWKNEHTQNKIVILESATILEKPSLAGLGDFVVVVDAPVEVRIDRALARDCSASRESVTARVANQTLMNNISKGLVPSEVDYVIDNGNDLERLNENLKKCVEFLMKQMCFDDEQKS